MQSNSTEFGIVETGNTIGLFTLALQLFCDSTLTVYSACNVHVAAHALLTAILPLMLSFEQYLISYYNGVVSGVNISCATPYITLFLKF